MLSSNTASATRYAECIARPRHTGWDIDRDVIRGRGFDFSEHFLPGGMSCVERLGCVDEGEQRLLSQIQGRSYANLVALMERCISIKMLALSQDHWLGDQVALEALIRFADEELKHQALFRRIDRMVADGMPPGYRFEPSPLAVAGQAMRASNWAALALSCHIGFCTQLHRRHSIEAGVRHSPLYRDVLLFHWKEESRHVVLDELEWERENALLSHAQRDGAVDDFIGLIGVLDDALRQQSRSDTRYFVETCGHPVSAGDAQRVADGLLGAYREQFIVGGVHDLRFGQSLNSMTSLVQALRVHSALRPLMG